MCVALIGGMDRLEKHYQEAAQEAGVSLLVFNTSQNGIGARLKKADVMVIFTNKVSHRVKNEAMKAAKAHGIPVIMEHSCGLCTWKSCLACIGGPTGVGGLCPGACRAAAREGFSH